MLSLGFPAWAYPVWLGCAALVLWCLVRAVRDQPVIFKQLIAGGIIEVLLLIQAIIGLAGVIGGHEIAEPGKFWGYVVVALLLLPAGAIVAIAERTRWSSVVLVVIVLALAVMQVRMGGLW